MTNLYITWCNMVGEYTPTFNGDKIVYDYTPVVYGFITVLLAWIVYKLTYLLIRSKK